HTAVVRGLAGGGRGVRGDRRAGGVPYFLEERAADEQYGVGPIERLADGERVEGQPEPEVRGGARQCLLRAEALAPPRGANLLGERGAPRRRTGHVIADDEGRPPAAQQQFCGALDPGGIRLRRPVEAARRKGRGPRPPR